MKVHTFLEQKAVSASVSRRVEKQVAQQLSTALPLCMEDLPILGQLSKPLQSELRVDMFSPDILQQSLFATLDSISGRSTKALCNTLELRLVQANQELFE